MNTFNYSLYSLWYWTIYKWIHFIIVAADDSDNDDAFSDTDYADVANLAADAEYADVANVAAKMNSHVQYRGLPPPPCGAYIPLDTTPPPNPREMYSHAGIYDVIPAEQVCRVSNITWKTLFPW